jgi:hypothetical protein
MSIGIRTTLRNSVKPLSTGALIVRRPAEQGQRLGLLGRPRLRQEEHVVRIASVGTAYSLSAAGYAALLPNTGDAS